MDTTGGGARRIVFPLDVPDPGSAEALVERLAGSVGIFKVGLELFVRCGPSIVDTLLRRGAARAPRASARTGSPAH